MPEHEPFSVDVGSKLLLVSILLVIFGVIAAILLPLMTAFAPNQPPGAIAGAIMPGLGLLAVGLLLGTIAGIFIGHAYRKYPEAFQPASHSH